MTALILATLITLTGCGLLGYLLADVVGTLVCGPVDDLDDLDDDWVDLGGEG